MLSSKDLIKISLDQGFVAAGISSPVLVTKSNVYLKNWLRSGYHAEMQWMTKNEEIRTNVLKSYPWVKSILVVADNYYLNHRREEGALKISRYAWGSDYHKIIKIKLKEVLNKLKSSDSKVEGKIYVDTGPILEKAFAVQAGLGWQGKNTNVVIKDFGSFCFLGVLLLNAPFEFNSPVKNRCGDCTSCIGDCPSGALVNPYVLDSRRCISYLTIEKKGEFSADELNWLNNWLYGCDICQEVCPWNHKWAKNTGDTRYYDRLKQIEQSPKEWMELTEHRFRELFKRSAVKRLKFDRLRRNLLAIIR